MSRAGSFPRGGVRPSGRKEATAGLPIRKACVPAEALIPLRQHAGEPAQCLVRAGQAVAEGMPIGRAAGPLEADVHASIPGVVKEIRQVLLPDGAASPAVVIALEGEFTRTGRARKPVDWRSLPREELLRRVEAGGVVGLDGVPAATRLRAAGGAAVLVANGAESEPYQACDERLLVEKAAEVLSGAAIAAFILGAGSVQVGVADDKPEALRVVTDAAAGFGFRVHALAARYPQGEEGLLVRALAGMQAPRGGRPEEPRTVAFNVGTLLAIQEAVVLELPQIERVVTVAGGAVRRPANLKARLGTPVAALLEECGAGEPARVIAGGPRRGFALAGLDVPLTKGTTAILALSRRELRPAARTPCIGCGRCGEACPWGLRPAELYKWLEHGEPAEARRRGLAECTECGCCAFVCPARIPLLQGLAAGRKQGAA
jgi:electron transport complex protein RnfC